MQESCDRRFQSLEGEWLAVMFADARQHVETGRVDERHASHVEDGRSARREPFPDRGFVPGGWFVPAQAEMIGSTAGRERVGRMKTWEASW